MNVRPIAPRFILDVHLGKLARHLRMLGFDSAWRQDFQDLKDEALFALGRAEGRILLTRDRTFAESVSPLEAYRVDATDSEQQLLEVLREFSLIEKARDPKGFLSRCLECNSPILPARGDQLHERLPAEIRLQHQEFFLCPRCERIYWKGSHYDRMREWAMKLLS